MTADSLAACTERRRRRPGHRSGSIRSRVFRSTVAAAVVAAGIAGCGGSSGGASDNGVAAKSPDAIIAAVMKATSTVKSVHVSGSVSSGSMPITLDLSLLAGKGGTGEMSLDGASFRMIVVNQTVYINGSDAFWKKVGGNSSVVELLHGKWFKAPVSGQFQGIAKLADVNALFTGLLTGHGTLAKGATSTVAGQKVIAVTDKTKGGTLYVATTGEPYPVQIDGTSGGQTLRVNFDQYNQPISLKAPANAINASALSSS